MNSTDRKILETALGLTEPLPLPNSLAEEIALVERKLAAEGDIGELLVDIHRTKSERENPHDRHN